MSNVNLTARDMEIISKAFQCFQGAEAMKIDADKLAQLAGFSNGKSANASWLVIKKKLQNGAAVDPATASTTTPKKSNKTKATPNADGVDNNGNEATTPTKAPAKKRAKAAVVKSELADAEHGDGDANNNDTQAPATTTPKRKRGPNKPKDPNATPTKRAKKGAKASADANDDAAAAGAEDEEEKEEEKSLFGGGEDVNVNVKLEVNDADVDDEDTEERKADEALFNAYTEVA